MRVEESYQVLELSSGCTEEDVKRAFRKKSMVTHPDKGGSAAEFRRLTHARDLVLAHIKGPTTTYRKVDDTFDVRRAYNDYINNLMREMLRRENARKRKVNQRTFAIRFWIAALFMPFLYLISMLPLTAHDQASAIIIYAFVGGFIFVSASLIADLTVGFKL